MANLRGVNNAKAFSEPMQLIKKNEKSGEVLFSVDSLTLPTGVAANDVLLMQEIPANAKVLRVKLLTGGLAAGDLDVGFSSSADFGDEDATVAAEPSAFIDAGDPDGVDEINMAVDASGYLSERAKPVYLTVTINTLPTGAAGNVVTTIVEYVAK